MRPYFNIEHVLVTRFHGQVFGLGGVLKCRQLAGPVLQLGYFGTFGSVGAELLGRTAVVIVTVFFFEFYGYFGKSLPTLFRYDPPVFI